MKIRPPFLILFSLILVLTGCDDNSSSSSTPPEGNATYRLTFNGTWSAATHPDLYPAGAHFSGLVGGTHPFDTTLWRVGSPASEGIRRMAEVGSKAEHLAEVNAMIRDGRACSTVSGSGAGAPGTASATFTISPDCPTVSVVSMIAPSPDWFTGVSGLDLAKGGEWVDSLTVDVKVYDAGTDSGETFTAGNRASSPREAIMPLSEFGNVGSFTFTRIE